MEGLVGLDRLGRHPGGDLLCGGLGQWWLGQGAFKDALLAYDKGMPNDQGAVPDLFNRGRLLRIAGEYELALKDHDRVVTLAPQVPMAYVGRGIARRFVGDVEGAIADLRQAAQLNPSSWAAQSHQWIWEMRMLRGQEGDRAAAIAELAAAREWASDPFASKIVDVCDGRVAPEAVIAEETTKVLRCVTFYYAGAKALVDGKHEEARAWFERCRDTGAHGENEFDLAQWHLRRLAVE